jgi:hypothetical protein
MWNFRLIFHIRQPTAETATNSIDTSPSLHTNSEPAISIRQPNTASHYQIIMSGSEEATANGASSDNVVAFKGGEVDVSPSVIDGDGGGDDAKVPLKEESANQDGKSSDAPSCMASAITSTAAPSTNEPERHWDNTHKKVVVHNVLKYIRAKEVEKLTSSWLKGHESLGIVVTKSKKPPKENWAKLTLQEESMVEPFIKLINEGGEGGGAMVNAKGKPMFAKRANEIDDRDNGRKRKERDGDDNSNNGRDNKRPNITKVLTNDEIRDAITPLWRMPYKEQLASKTRELTKKCAMKIVKEIKGKFRTLEQEAKRGHRDKVELYDWVGGKRVIEIEDPVPSPKIFEYRNKCEFTFGYQHVVEKAEEGGDGKKDGGDDGMEGVETPASDAVVKKVPAVGFLPQGWNGGVYPPHCLQNMP